MDNIIPPQSPTLDYFDEYANGHSYDNYNEYLNEYLNCHHNGYSDDHDHNPKPSHTEKTITPPQPTGHVDVSQYVVSTPKPLTVEVINVPLVPPVSLAENLKPLDPCFVVKCLRHDEFGDAELLAELYKDRICYDHIAKKWFLWQGHYWAKDKLGTMKLIIPSYLAAQYILAAGAIQQQVNVEPSKNKFAHLVPASTQNLEAALRTLIEQLQKAAKRLRFRKRRNAILDQAQPLCGITGEEWDSDPWLLGVKNGVLQLKKGEIGFRNGQPRDYIRTYAPTEWKGLEAAAPRFETFLSEILEGATDKEATTHYMQNLLGYAILGSAHENMFAILYGDRGQNGKGTLFKVLNVVLGDRLCGTVEEDVFLSKRKGSSGSASPHLLDLRGMRMAWCAETSEGDRLNGAQVKRLTGNEPLKARGLYQQDPVQWRPTHTLFLMTNNKPHVNAEDNAMWIRIALIPFLMTFNNNPQGPYERQKAPFLFDKLTSEAGKSGLLALLVKWCIRYQQEGLNLPKCLQAAKEAYRDEEDTIGHFIAECCSISQDAKECLHRGRTSRTLVSSSNLYNSYKEWHTENSPRKPMSSTAFGKKMKKRFFQKRKSEKGKVARYFYGIKLIK